MLAFEDGKPAVRRASEQPTTNRTGQGVRPGERVVLHAEAS